MSNSKFALKVKPSCWTCRKLRKSKRQMCVDKNGNSIDISAPSVIDALAAYYCKNYWFSSEPDEEEMLCGGLEYESYTSNYIK